MICGVSVAVSFPAFKSVNELNDRRFNVNDALDVDGIILVKCK
jgi:hypothetical protein